MTHKTGAKAALPGLKVWFDAYIDQFSSEDPVVQENMDMKANHTRRVCAAVLDIGQTLHLSTEDLCMAEAAGLLHDIGRFEQYRRYRTFFDFRSENHAALGVKVIAAHGILDGLDPAAADLIVRLVKYHNRAALPAGEDPVCLFFLKLLRDADKIDIWRVVTEYYRNGANHRNRALELDLPDTGSISQSVYESLMNGRIVKMADLETVQDFKLLQMGWIYDVNFTRTFQIVRDNRYLEIIRGALPIESEKISEIYSRARTYLNRHAAG